MIQIKTTEIYQKWLSKIKDNVFKVRLATRLRRLKLGNFGDVKSIGDGVSELRIDYGPGYRIYFTRQGNTIILLLCGGDKRTQDKDIKRAKEMLKC